jgi:ubiquinone/menaquinone biosynthesis C-methylase UbiE
VETSSTNVVDRERDFYNEKSDRYVRIREWIWRGIGEFNRNSELAELYDPLGKRMLLYGCGPANGAGRFLDAGAIHVSGIDISDGEISQAWRSARAGGYADRVDFRAGDAHATGFEDGAFDLIVGSAIVHHLDIPRALTEIRRILKPGGRAVFLEPLAHNPLLRLGRALTPSARTADEHPLTVRDWEVCARQFPNFTHREVEFISIPLMPLNLVLPRSLQRVLARRVRKLDDRLLARYPRLSRYARSTFLILE